MKQMKNMRAPCKRLTKGLKKFDDIQDRVTTITDGVTDGITAVTDFTEAVSGAFPAGAGGEFNMHGSTSMIVYMCFVMDGHMHVELNNAGGGYVQEPGAYVQEPSPRPGTHCSSKV